MAFKAGDTVRRRRECFKGSWPESVGYNSLTILRTGEGGKRLFFGDRRVQHDIGWLASRFEAVDKPTPPKASVNPFAKFY